MTRVGPSSDADWPSSGPLGSWGPCEGAGRVVTLLGCGDRGDAGWKRQTVESVLKMGLDDDATAFRQGERE